MSCLNATSFYMIIYHQNGKKWLCLSLVVSLNNVTHPLYWHVCKSEVSQTYGHQLVSQMKCSSYPHFIIALFCNVLWKHFEDLNYPIIHPVHFVGMCIISACMKASDDIYWLSIIHTNSLGQNQLQITQSIAKKLLVDYNMKFLIILDIQWKLTKLKYNNWKICITWYHSGNFRMSTLKWK